MKVATRKFVAGSKLILMVLRPHILLGWMAKPFEFAANTLRMTKWAASQHSKGLLNDFPSFKRNYNKRYELYEYVAVNYGLHANQITFLEFGVSGGYSFNWWVNSNNNEGSGFFGFDTFEGLPEKWGAGFSRGDMAAPVPEMADRRVKFIKGLFQETLSDFLKGNRYNMDRQLVIHMDADLFSSTLYALSQVSPYLKKGDVLIFDEFCVPNHEFNAWRTFTRSFYVRMRLVAAVNNYLQVAFIVE
ncbi:MAG: class I SAM-dependent methyltransferase [Bacteroidales bacterium]|jgi:hypothetical protein|nr:class I SAM-dependent methyltransferase [Bacteroidales bacterium]